MKFAISYSFGKDSALALWRMVRECIDEGFAITIKCVQNEYRFLLGRCLDGETLEDIHRSGPTCAAKTANTTPSYTAAPPSSGPSPSP